MEIRVRKVTSQKVWNDQCGFKVRKSCIDQTFYLRLVVEKLVP